MGMDDEIRWRKQADEAMLRAMDPYHGLSDSMKAAMGLAPYAGPHSALASATSDIDEMRKTLSLASGGVNPGSTAFAIASGAAHPDISRVSGFADRYAAEVRALQGALPDLQRSGFFKAASQLDGPFSAVSLANDRFAERFRLPETTEFARLAREASEASKLLQSVSGFSSPHTALTLAMQSMQTPWLLRDDVSRSVSAFSDVQIMGRILNASTPFDENVAQALRGALGDWRDVTTFPTPIFENVLARTDFYVGLGFDPSLTEFTADAFDESTVIAGLRSKLDEDEEAEDYQDDEVGLARSTRAHAQIIRFERSVRRFIEKMMLAGFGQDWMRRQLPQGMLESWQAKKATDVAKGKTDQPLIAYADFSDYIKIIERKDNWAGVFKAVFKRQSDIQEAFTRLFPVRICTMHSRIITLDDELLLLVETRRIQKALSEF